MVVRTVVIGLGPMGLLHAKALTQNANFNVVGGSDPELRRRDAIAGVAFESDAATLMDKTSPDLVVIAAPPGHHASLVRTAIAHGAHVLCEKPLAANLAQAMAMVEAARTSGRICAVNLQLRFSPARQEMRRLISEGALGRLVGLRAVLASPGYHEIAPPWYRDLTLGGGVLMELGTHVIDQMAWVGGQITSSRGVSFGLREPRAATGSSTGPTGEDHVNAILRFRGGHTGELMVSTLAIPDPPRSLEVYGDRGGLKLTGETRLEFSEPGHATAEIPIEPDEYQSLTGDPRDSYTQPLQRFYAHLADVLVDGRPETPLATFAEAAAVQAVIDQVRQGNLEVLA